ncbi:MAG: methyltransferase domain-containing protein [Pseudomonadota bacterium]
MSDPVESQVARHYDRSRLLEAILKGLNDQGSDLNVLRTEDLAPVDEFHTAGRLTTIKALDMTPIQPEMKILDAGCEIGGTSRYLAHEWQCNVDGIDLTPEYVEVARGLSKRLSLQQMCAFHIGSILELPFADDE